MRSYKIYPLLGLKMTQNVELGGGDLFFLVITPIFLFLPVSVTLPRQSNLEPHLSVPLLIEKTLEGP